MLAYTLIRFISDILCALFLRSAVEKLIPLSGNRLKRFWMFFSCLLLVAMVIFLGDLMNILPIFFFFLCSGLFICAFKKCVCVHVHVCVYACAHVYARHVLLGSFAFFLFLLRDGKKAWRWMVWENLGDEGKDGGYCHQTMLYENYIPKIINRIQDFL